MAIDLSVLEEADYGSVDMFNMRYANYPKDLIMGVLPNSQFGDVSLVTPPITAITQQVGSSTNNMFGWINGQNLAIGGSDAPTNSIYKDNLDKLFNFSILALRQAEFLQKWKEVAQTAKQDYRDQIKAHWNVEVSKARSGLTEYLGGITSNISLDGVTNTSLASNNETTVIKGIGMSGQRGRIEYDVPEHGIIMCIYHAAPILDYNASRLYDPFVLKTSPLDYAIPEMDKAGMQLVSDEYLDKYVGGSQDSYLGYAPRYIDYKTDIDKVFGSFNNVDKNWVAPFESFDQNVLYNSYLRFKVRSSIFDDVFEVNSDSTLATDQLLCNADFNIKCVRNLDVNGMPY